ncbi:MAG: UvrD-helicase domain-containing protein [Bacteroidales bacterium]|nr:UvrD-helicase domain-containing protein [Bacteroidales bacterium]
MNITQNFSVYKSSAGSGKTYTLVREYIALALQSPAYFRHILAITFTNKAANEMKQRIIQGLMQLADPITHTNGAVIKFMLPDLVTATGFTSQEVTQRAQAVLTRILHEYDDFSVRTIDSFVSRIIRTFAHDLHLPVDFEIEMDRDLMLDEAVEQLISKAGVDKDLTSILVDFTEAKADDEKSWNIETDIKKTAGFLFSEGSQHFINKLHEIPPARLNEIAREIRQIRKSFEDSIITLAQSAKKLITNNSIDNASFARGTSGIGGYFFKLAEGIIAAPNSYVLTTINDNKWIAAKADTIQISAINSVKDQLTTIYHQCDGLMKKGSTHYALLGMIEKNIFQMGVLSAMETEIDTIRREKKILHISEFNKRITDIILKEPVPFIYERIGEKYYNYLIDEFQDTSELQWKNLLPLIGDSLAYGRYNLVVGDGKQAIYRFRNGQVEQFMMLPALPDNYEKEVFGDAEQALGTNYNPKVLKSNFRSLPEIINFNNDFFGFLANQLSAGFQSIYTDHAQETSPDKTGGLVSVEFLPYHSRAEFDELNIKRVHDLVLDLNDKGFANADIAILTRSNREGSIIARHLMSQGISVVSAEALLLSASPEVNFVVTVLQHIGNPQNLVAVAGILNELIRKGKINTSLIQNFPVSKTERFSLEKALSAGNIEFNIKSLRGLPLYDLCEEIIRIFELNTGDYNIYLQFFLDFANKVSARQGTHLADLLEAWDEKKGKLSVVVPEGIDAIRIMTIHKSKGLEFPVVIWPMATEKLKTTFDQLWVDLEEDVIPGLPVALLQTGLSMEDVGYSDQYQKERNSSMLDMINLIYVAFTRPAERLYIISREPGNGDANNLPNLLTQYIESTSEEWTQNGNVYFRGIDEHVQKMAEPLPVSNMLSSMISSPWQGRIKIARRAPVYWSTDQSKNKQAWGTLIHDTLAAIRTKDDILEIVAKQALVNLLDEEQTELLLSRVTATVNHDLLKDYFNESVQLKPEAGILTPKGDVFRPDRVIFNKNETIILEFKTGLPKPGHEIQLNNYGEILLQMGYPGIRKLLVYLDETITVKNLNPGELF